MCEQNKLGLVDIDILRCLSCDHIPKLLIEKYLVEICRSQNVPFEPDATVMAQDEFWTIGQRYVQNSNVNNETRPPVPPPPLQQPPAPFPYGGGAAGGPGARTDFPAVPSTPFSAPQVNMSFDDH
jgi:vacuolar protein sorting-associated protein IST1